MTYFGLFLTDKCLMWEWLIRRSFEWFADVKVGEMIHFLFSSITLYDVCFKTLCSKSINFCNMTKI